MRLARNQQNNRNKPAVSPEAFSHEENASKQKI